jgi:hypothetical protein
VFVFEHDNNRIWAVLKLECALSAKNLRSNSDAQHTSLGCVDTFCFHNTD